MWWSGGLGLLARCPSAVHSIPERIGVPGAVALEGQRGSSGVVQSWQIWGEVGRAVLGGQSGVTWS